MTIKNPTAPATDPQVNTIESLADELAYDLGDKRSETGALLLTKGEASALITQLLGMKKQAKAAPAPSLMAMAAAIEGKSAPIEDEAQVAPTAAELAAFEKVTAKHGIDPKQSMRALILSEQEAKTLLSWYPIVAGEIDPTEDDDLMEQKLQLFLNPISDAQIVAAAKPVTWDQIPEGHYAVTGEDGTTDFYRVQFGKAGTKWEGFLFLDQQVSDDYLPIKNMATKKAIAGKIAADGPLAASKRYGTELGVCGVCHKTLTDPQSIEDGIGPVCKAKLGA